MINHRDRNVNITISTQSLVKILLILAAIGFLYMIKDILAILFVAIMLSSAFGPWVDFLERKKVPRGIGLILLYILLVTVIGGAILLLIPPITNQFAELSANFPRYSDKLLTFFRDFQNYTAQSELSDAVAKGLKSLEGTIGQIASGVFIKIFDIIGGLVAFFVVFVVTFYMTVEDSFSKKAIRYVVPKKYLPYINRLINRIQKKIGLWLKGQLILCLIIGVLSFIGLSILGVDYALILALIAGITEFMPIIGPVMGAIPAIFIAFNQSPLLGASVAILYIFIQRMENDFLVPKVMQKTVGLNPLISIIAILIGGKIAGIIGVLLAIPVTTAIGVIVRDFWGEDEDDEVERAKEQIEKIPENL